MKTNKERYELIKKLEEYEERCLVLNETPILEGCFKYKTVKKGKKKRKYDVILLDINYAHLPSYNTLIIPDIFNKIDSSLNIKGYFEVIDFGNIESLPNLLCNNNTYLKKVTGKRVYNVGYCCFSCCQNLKEIDFPLLNSVKRKAFEKTRIEIFNQNKVDFIDGYSFFDTNFIKQFKVNKIMEYRYELMCNNFKMSGVEEIEINYFNSAFGLKYLIGGYNILNLKKLVIKNYIPNSVYDAKFYFEKTNKYNEHIRLKHLYSVINTNLKCKILSSEEKMILCKYTNRELLGIIKEGRNNINLCLGKNLDIPLLSPSIDDRLSEKIYVDIHINLNYQIKRLQYLGFKPSEIKEYIELEKKYILGNKYGG